MNRKNEKAKFQIALLLNFFHISKIKMLLSFFLIDIIMASKKVSYTLLKIARKAKKLK
jgi:hypothetical protein